MDSNHDKQIQNLLCYRYTTRQFEDHKHWLYGLFPKTSPKGDLMNNPSSSVEGTWIMHKLSIDFNPNHTLHLSQRCLHTCAAFWFFQQPFPK